MKMMKMCSPYPRGWTVIDARNEDDEDVFPVSTGLNRAKIIASAAMTSVPRIHGVEPQINRILIRSACVFPVSTGLNRVAITNTGSF